MKKQAAAMCVGAQFRTADVEWQDSKRTRLISDLDSTSLSEASEPGHREDLPQPAENLFMDSSSWQESGHEGLLCMMNENNRKLFFKCKECSYMNDRLYHR